LVLAGILAPRAEWVHDGVAISTASDHQHSIDIASDGAGGAVMVWRDDRNGLQRELYTQKIDVNGDIQWAVDGALVCAAAGYRKQPRIASDGAGGAIITWYDYRDGNGDIYVQRFDASGAALWTTDGVAICANPSHQDHSEIVSDGSGGAIVSWVDWRNGRDIYAQRVDANGDTLWAADGVVVCAAPGEQYVHDIVADGSGGAAITWSDYRNWQTTGFDIYAQRIDANGDTLWAANGVPLCEAGGDQNAPQLNRSGNDRFVFSWSDTRFGGGDIFAQAVDLNGIPQWTTDGVAACTTGTWLDYSHVVSDGAGGAIISWHDYDLMQMQVQRVDASGAPQWGPYGVLLGPAEFSYFVTRMVSDDNGGAVVAWSSSLVSFPDVYAQRVGADGTKMWGPDGVVICGEPDNQLDVVVAPDGTGGAVMAWVDYRNPTADIYAHRVDRSGHTGLYYPPLITAVEDVPDDQGGSIFLQWERSALDTLPNNGITHYSTWRRLPQLVGVPPEVGSGPGGDLVIPIDFAGVAARAAGGYSWEWLGNVPAHHFDNYTMTVDSPYDSMGSDPHWQYFMVSAHTVDSLFYYDSAIDSGYSADNLSPAAPQGLAGTQQIGPDGLLVSWFANSEEDLSNYVVHRGPSPGFIPTPANRIASTTDTTAFDGDWVWDSGFFYKVAARDVHGNEGLFADLGPPDIVGVSSEVAPRSVFLRQNFPNPFNPTTTIRFGVDRRVRVSIVIYDASGRKVRTLFDEVREPSHYSEVWDGRDDAGTPVATGVYLYRLRAGEIQYARKMLLIK
jgi:hypothetical protein